MPHYRTKPTSVEAFQWNGRLLDLPDWLRAGLVDYDPYSGLSNMQHGQCALSDDNLAICYNEGVHAARKGDWVVRGARGELYVVDAMTFNLGFEPDT